MIALPHPQIKAWGAGVGITFLRSLFLLFHVLGSNYHPIDIDFYEVGIAAKDIRLEETTDILMSLREITRVITTNQYHRYSPAQQNVVQPSP